MDMDFSPGDSVDAYAELKKRETSVVLERVDLLVRLLQ